jgi:hypothetical protein
MRAKKKASAVAAATGQNKRSKPTSDDYHADGTPVNYTFSLPRTKVISRVTDVYTDAHLVLNCIITHDGLAELELSSGKSETVILLNSEALDTLAKAFADMAAEAMRYNEEASTK